MSEEKQKEAWVDSFLKESIKEQRRARRWKIFFRLVLAVYVGIGMYIFHFGIDTSVVNEEEIGKHVAVVDVRGAIVDSPQGASAEIIIKGLQKAFKAEDAVAVIIEINSPGGSPVQSAQVYREIMRLKEKHPERPVYAVANDIAASGAYYIASAANEIYADPTSLVGSVGVIMGGFGFSEIMDKVGVERRVYTAGKYKAFMDPYSDENPETIAYIKELLKDTHNQFIKDVRAGRGDRIKGTDEELFNGLVWTGTRALDIGLIDGLSSTRELAREKLHVDKVVNYSYQPNPFERLVDRLGASFAGELFTAVGGNLQIR